MHVTFMPELTKIVIERHKGIKDILSSSMDITIKTVNLRNMARDSRHLK